MNTVGSAAKAFRLKKLSQMKCCYVIIPGSSQGMIIAGKSMIVSETLRGEASEGLRLHLRVRRMKPKPRSRDVKDVLLIGRLLPASHLRLVGTK